jgi:hypothetical protein
MVAGLFGTTGRTFRLGSAAALHCSNAVQPKVAGNAMQHEHRRPCEPFCLDAAHGLLWRGEQVIALSR